LHIIKKKKIIIIKVYEKRMINDSLAKCSMTGIRANYNSVEIKTSVVITGISIL